MNLTSRLCLTLVLASTFGNAVAKVHVTSDTPADVIAKLEQQDTLDLYDMHGNANGDLQQLMVLRFDATAVVMDSIDRMEEDPSKRALNGALYRVLGFVKDPASIGWLRAKLRTDQAKAIYDCYLPTWRTRLDGFGSWEWLTIRQGWIAFWRDAFNSESSPERRVNLLPVLAGFDDSSVLQFFEDRRMVATDPKEILIVESYLGAHDFSPDGKRIQAAIDVLARSSENCDFLIQMASELRHEAFVPFLVEVVDVPERHVTSTSYLGQRVLRSITFELAVEGKDAWRNWFAIHANQGRDQWRQQVLDSFRETLKQTPDRVKEWFAKGVYYWNDIAVLPFIESELAPRSQFHNDVAGWINLTYTDFYRQRLRTLADSISHHPERLEGWALRLLQERGYISGKRKRTWTETVHNANMVL